MAFEPTMTKEEYDKFIEEWGFPPGSPPTPGEKHRNDRNKDSINHTHHSRGI